MVRAENVYKTFYTTHRVEALVDVSCQIVSLLTLVENGRIYCYTLYISINSTILELFGILLSLYSTLTCIYMHVY